MSPQPERPLVSLRPSGATPPPEPNGTSSPAKRPTPSTPTAVATQAPPRTQPAATTTPSAPTAASSPSNGTTAGKTPSKTPPRRKVKAIAVPTKGATNSTGKRKPARKAVRATGHKTTKHGPAQLADLTAGLHESWRESLEAYRLRVEAQFRELKHAVQGKKPLGAKATASAKSALKTNVKPRKGRAKDLKRVEEAVAKALGHVAPK